MSFLLLSNPYLLDSKTERLPAPQTEPTPRLAAVVVAPAIPITVESKKPPKPKKASPTPKKSVKRASFSRKGNCVSTLRAAGYEVPRTKNGYAGTIPTSLQDISEGETAVAVTNEGPVGHVVAVKKVNGKLISVTEGNHPVGAGREVPASVVKGFVSQDEKATQPVKEEILEKTK